MITGDIKETARAIASDIGIIDKFQTDRCFTGLEFFSFSEKE
jgi:magnesium-transporting ATPase (P-type)